MLRLADDSAWTSFQRHYAWSDFSDRLFAEGKRQKALFAAIVQVTKTPDDPFAWFQFGKLAYDSKEFFVARCCFKRVLEMDPSEDYFWFHCSESALDAKEYELCRKIAKRGLRRFPNTRCLMELIGLAYQEDERWDLASKWFARARATEGDSILKPRPPADAPDQSDRLVQ